MLRRAPLPFALLALLLLGLVSAADDAQFEALWEAAREGNLAEVKRLHAHGVDVNASTRYGATALSYACDKGHIDVVRYLIDNNADVNAKDTFYEFTPIGWALFNEHDDIVMLLLEKGSEGADRVLATAAGRGDKDLLTAALATGQINEEHVAQAIERAANAENKDEIVALLEAAEVKPVERAEVEIEPSVLDSYAGTYTSTDIGMTIEVRFEEGKLVAQPTGQPALNLRALEPARFEAVEAPQVVIVFSGRGGTTEQLIVEQGGQTVPFKRADSAATEDAGATAEEAPGARGEQATAAAEEAATAIEIVRGPARNWPRFRGPNASGIGDGQGAPTQWQLEGGENVRWKTPIPGLANSSPIVWGDRVFVTTAISGKGDDTFRTGLYGDVNSVDDESEHEFRVYGLDKESGKILWERTVTKAVPGAKRHLKSTQANSTPVTDGKRVVALFGTVGLLVCFDSDGKELWRKDLGILDAGWFYDRSYQWGHASSPVIHDDRVIVQADIYAGSFIAAYRLTDGKQLWRTTREDVPSWGSPTVYDGDKREELITNGKTIKGYDPQTGKELWSLEPNSEVTVATPVIAHGMFFVTAGYPPVQPIYAIRPGSQGDLTLGEGAESSEAIAWSKSRGGTYIPTPIVYGDYLYTCANDGRLTCYEAKTGERVYRARVAGGGGSFTASPVAADGRLYFTDETGDITVVRAGAAYEEIATNSMNEVCMSTPAISDGFMIVRTMGHIYGLGQPPEVE